MGMAQLVVAAVLAEGRSKSEVEPGLPTPAPTVNDVARHLCTVSRDITATAGSSET
jgi:hypothetical protein